MAIGEISAGGTIIGGMIGQRGAPGNGIASIEKTGESGLVDTYTITYTNGDTTTYNVTNGAKGDTGDTGAQGEPGIPGTTDYNELSNKPNLSVYSLVTETGNKIGLEMNNSTYVLTAKLYDKSNNLLSTSSGIDLPLESMIVSGTYDTDTKTLVLTLDNGNTIEMPIGDLIDGLQTEITATNKLNSDFVDDTGHTNLFVTSSDKTTWNAKVGTTDYATSSTGGVVKISSGEYGLIMDNGVLKGSAKTYSQYVDSSSRTVIAKGTLENVLSEKIGDINSAIDLINGEVI